MGFFSGFDTYAVVVTKYANTAGATFLVFYVGPHAFIALFCKYVVEVVCMGLPKGLLGYLSLGSEARPGFWGVEVFCFLVEPVLASDLALCFSGEPGDFALAGDTLLGDKLVYCFSDGVPEEAPHFIRGFRVWGLQQLCA